MIFLEKSELPFSKCPTKNYITPSPEYNNPFENKNRNPPTPPPPFISQPPSSGCFFFISNFNIIMISLFAHIETYFDSTTINTS